MADLTREDLELAAIYVAETRLPYVVVCAFVRAGLEPPPRDRVDRVGYSTREVRLILAASVS